ncbi:MAG: hypothetical protein AAGH83_04395 [Pseudomonadota bacterium]
MFGNISNLRRALNDIEGGLARFVVMGDLNTMGRDPFEDEDETTSKQEIADLTQFMAQGGMTLQDKSAEKTFLKYKDHKTVEFETDLDHVISSDVTPLKTIANGAKVLVRGWNDLTTDEERIEWTRNISDHASIEIEIDL